MQQARSAVTNKVVALITLALIALFLITSFLVPATPGGGGQPTFIAELTPRSTPPEDTPTTSANHFSRPHMKPVVVGASDAAAQKPPSVMAIDSDLADAFQKGECGLQVLESLGLQLTTSDAHVQTQHQKSFIVTSNQENRDVQFAGRAIHLGAADGKLSFDSVLMLAPTVARVNTSAWSVTFGPCYYDEGDDEVEDSSERRRRVIHKDFGFDIIATWVGSKYLGQKWRLPDRNDNPPFEMMKQKCHSLSLRGDCERHGVTLLSTPNFHGGSASGSKWVPSMPLECLPRNSKAPACGALEPFATQSTALFGNGQWRSTFPTLHASNSSSQVTMNEVTQLQALTLDDPVDLNHVKRELNGDKLVMAWEPPCSPKVGPSFFGSKTRQLGAITAEDVAVSLHNHFKLPNAASDALFLSFSYTIALFGDSMMVEQFHMWCQLFYGHEGHNASFVRQGKSMGLRWMHVEKVFKIPLDDARLKEKRTIEGQSADGTISIILRIRFARSYTTKGGNSVLASVGTIIKQILSVDADVVAGNLASLHWQQNMRSQLDWEANLNHFGDGLTKSLLRVKSAAIDDKAKKERLFYFWGNTMIQMGRTQGLNSGRTTEFNRAAKRILGSLQHPVSGPVVGSADVSSESSVSLVTYFDPYHLSVSRRESSFDGQHWACYHRYGGVSMTITQLWIAHLCHVAL